MKSIIAVMKFQNFLEYLKTKYINKEKYLIH
jgi:hypothetical protein